MPRPDAYVLECAFASNPDDMYFSQVWTDITPFLDAKAGVRITRGRTDEFSEIQPSTFACVLRNDGRFTPDNPSSPYFPNVKTGKKLRFGLLVKGNGKQLDTDPSFGGAAPFQGTNDRAPWQSKAGFPVTTIAQTTSFAQFGSASMQLTLPTASSTNAIVQKFVYGLVPGRTYTASAYIRVPTGSPQMNWTVGGAGVVSTTVNNAFERKSVTFVATDTKCEIALYTNAASTAGQLIQVDGVQVEEGASATTFEGTAASFTWRFTGEVNEWPTKWEGGPAQLAQASITATDQFKRLGELGELLTTIDEDVLDDIPFAYYPLNEPAGVGGSTISAGDISGNDENPLIAKQYGAGGTITFGSEPGIPDFYVQKRTTVAINPVDENTGAYLRATLKNTRRQFTPDGATVNVFAMESVSPLTTGPLIILSGTDGSWFGVRKRSNGNITAAFFDGPTTTLYEVNSGIGMSNNSPRMYTARLEFPSAGNGRIRFYASAVETGTAVDFPLPQGKPNWYAASVGGRGSEMFRGYLSHAAFYDWAVSTGGIIGWWFSAFKGTDGAGSTSYARMDKLAAYTNLDRPIRFSGLFTPAKVGPQEIEGQPIDQMQKIETTEGGQWYIRGDGQPMFRLRNYRYNAAPAMTIQSERLDPDEIQFRGDDFGLTNDVTASRSDGATARIVNEASKADHGRRKAQFDVLATTDDELRAIAAWNANTFGTQKNRITGVKISLLNDPTIVVAALQTDISRRITIASLPSEAPETSVDLYIEGWSEVISEDEWSMQYNTSPAESWDVWQLGVAGHSELGLTTRIGH